MFKAIVCVALCGAPACARGVRGVRGGLQRSTHLTSSAPPQYEAPVYEGSSIWGEHQVL